jgi:hypothetical protein
MSNSAPFDTPPVKFNGCIAAFVAPNSASQGLPIQKPTTNAPESLVLPLTASLTTQALSSSSLLTKSTQTQEDSKPKVAAENTSQVSALDIAVSTPIPAAPSPTPVVEFSDVSNNSWASRWIQRLKTRNIVVGFPDGRFRPERYATRAEFAAMLQKIFGKENSKSGKDFKDLTANYWASNAIKKVSKTGILKGYPAEDFRPDQPVTRAEVLVALATALNLKTSATPAKTLQVYLDGDQVLDYALAKVAAAQEAGLVAGYTKEKLLVPNKPATRAELAVMFSQALAIAEKGEKVSTH